MPTWRPTRASQRVVALRAAIEVSADYGITAPEGAGADAGAFVEFVLDQRGQAILARHGFTAR